LDIDAKTHPGTAQRAFHSLVTSSAFGRLARVQSLRLSNIDWTCFSVSEQSAIEGGLARLTQVAKFELYSLYFHELKGALRVANAFPLLNHIRIIDVHFSKYLQFNIASARTLKIPLTWEVVEIDSGDAIPSFLYCVCANLAVAPLGIRLLKVLHIDDDHHSYVEDALRSIDFKRPS
jgi:hypothetical protein